ncbi:hypothetical protein [Streptomyces xiamenensis]|uniref:hypothetical protein n=1 Tax=Streptomyces xiamenensis TaxID=408015 RepID=UPI003D7208E7
MTAYEDLLPVALRIWGPDHLGSLMARGCLVEARTRRDTAPADGLAVFAVLTDRPGPRPLHHRGHPSLPGRPV